THKIMPTIRLLFTVMDNIGDPPPGMTHHNHQNGCGSDKNNKWHTIEFSNNIRTLGNRGNICTLISLAAEDSS
ncbi:hypothetical protein, partial [Corynebacterium glutamicum]|uniref:hypothetical protein n=1 Tax=Corynebacterium glutamicum TaxID=1718 RepID=UPI001C95A5AC